MMLCSVRRDAFLTLLTSIADLSYNLDPHTPPAGEVKKYLLSVCVCVYILVFSGNPRCCQVTTVVFNALLLIALLLTVKW